MVRAVQRINLRRPHVVVAKLERLLGSLEGKTIGVLGLAFKPNSDDMREASSLSVIPLLQEQGCQVKAYDPVAMKTAARLIPTVSFCADAYQVAAGSDALLLVTEWDEFKELDMRRLSALMSRPILVDGCNFYHPQQMADAGFIYEGMGRGSLGRERPEAALASDEEKGRRPMLSGRLA